MGLRYKSTILLVFLALLQMPSVFSAAEPEIKAASAILAMSNGGQILYDKNPDQKAYPANLTKLMTALTAYKSCDADGIVTIPENLGEYISPFEQTMNLRPGEQIKAIELLKAILVGSYNDAAVALALHCAGSVEGFVDRMNEQAAALGLAGTSFANPTGAHDSMNYTTASDLLVIYKKIYSVPPLRDIIEKPYITVGATNKSNARTFWTNNSLSTGYYGARYLYNYAKGGKASSSTAGGCGVAVSAAKGDDRFICIVLGSVQDESVNFSFIDAKKILEYGFNDFTQRTILRQDSIVSEIKVKNAKGTSRGLLLAESTVRCYVQKGDENPSIGEEKNVPGFIKAPITKGEPIGSIVYAYNGRPAGGVRLVADSDIGVDKIKLALSGAAWFISLKYVRLALIIIIGTTVIYFAIIALIITKSRRHAENKKNRAKQK